MASTLDGRFVHEPTAMGADYAFSKNNHDPQPQQEQHSSTATATAGQHAGLKYSLTHGKKGISAAMAIALRRSNKDKSATRQREDGTAAISNGKKKSSSTSSSGKHSGKMKIFVLLLEPKTKTFELIQLVFLTETTTIGDILSMIPHHATEIQLGSQKYKGLCRPNKEIQDFCDLSLLASANPQQKPCANIASGEILVAIPNDYSAQDVAKFSQAILTNKRFTKLLNKNKTRSSKSKRSKHSSSSRKHAALLEHGEEVREDEQNMQMALEKAAMAAAQANSSIHQDHDPYRINPVYERSASDFSSMDSSMAESRKSFSSSSWVNGGASIASKSIGSTNTGAESLDESLSSWSKSLDQSFASTGKSSALFARHRQNPNRSFASLRTTTDTKRRARPNKQQSLFKFGMAATVAAMALAFMIYNYYHRDETGQRQRVQEVNNPMGLFGFLQVVFILLFMKKIQFLSNRRAKGLSLLPTSNQSKCPMAYIFAKK